MNKTVWSSRGSEEFPRTFVPKDIDLGNWEEIQPLFNRLLEEDPGEPQDLESWLYRIGELDSCLSEEGSRRYIAMTCDTTDEAAEKNFLRFLTEIEPSIKPQHDRINRKYLSSPVRARLDGDRYRVFDRDVENDVGLFREENIPLQTEDDKLRQEYQKICGAMTVRYEGEEKTLPQMRKYLEETDRSVRRRAWEKITERFSQDRVQFEELYDRMIPLRDRIGCNAGFENYRDYIHQAKGRFDYNPEDCFRFHEAVEAEIVPLNRKLAAKRR